MLPLDFDGLSFREILLVIRATEDVARDAWKRAATISAFVFNSVPRKGSRAKSPADLFPDLFERSVKRLADFEAHWQQAMQTEERYLRLVERSRKRREQNGPTKR